VPAYGYSPQGVNYNRQFKGTAQWVPELNALRETDPQAYAEIERRANEIVFDSKYDVYSKSMEGGTGARWERDPMSRALFQAFQEYKRPQVATQTDRPMPVDAPYGQATEKAIRQVMQSMGLTRIDAIRYLSQSAVDPEVRGELGAVGKMADVYRQRPSTMSTLSKASGDVATGQGTADVVGVDSPENAVVAEPDQPDLAPGEERVTGASEQQVNAGGYGMGPLMSGGEMVYGKPVTEVGEGEKRAGLLQALATAGASYFGGRDIKAANRQAAQGTASANLINALAGNIVAQAPRITPSAGVATSMMKGLAAASNEFIRRERSQRELDQQAMMTKLSGARYSTKADPNNLKEAFVQDGARVAADWDKEEAEFYAMNTVTDPKNMGPNLKKMFFQVPPNQRQGFLAAYRQGFTDRFQKVVTARTKEKDRTTQRRSELRAIAIKLGEAAGKNAADPDTGIIRTPEIVFEEFEEAGAGLSAGDKTYFTNHFLAAKLEEQGSNQYKFTWDSFQDLADAEAFAGVAPGGNRKDFWQFLDANPGIAEYFGKSQNLKAGVSLGAVKNIYDSAYIKAEEKRIASLAKPNAVKMELANLAAGRQKIMNLESLYAKVELKGPILGRLPAWQYFVPNKAAYEKEVSGFAVELAAIINQGRPSDKDAEAVRLLLPLSSDTMHVASELWDNLHRMMEAKKIALEEEFDVPIWSFVKSGENGIGNFDLDAYKAAVVTKTLTTKGVSGMLDQLNGTSGGGERRSPATGKGKEKILKTFEKAGFTVRQNSDGVYEVVEEGAAIPDGDKSAEATFSLNNKNNPLSKSAADSTSSAADSTEAVE